MPRSPCGYLGQMFWPSGWRFYTRLRQGVGVSAVCVIGSVAGFQGVFILRRRRPYFFDRLVVVSHHAWRR